MRIQVTGLSALRAEIQKTSQAVEQSNVIILNRISEETIKRARRGFQESPPSGAVYTRYNPYRIHTASAPSGNAYPRKDTNELSRSLRFTPATRAQLYSSVGTNLPYGEDLELGTNKMMPRPWLGRSYRSAVRTVAKEIRNIYKRQK